ncbi:MAG: rhodanese-like domain-containing protein [Cyclobacteriaceae bacterium]|jgi:rhodanese-related sulfurtransferase|nr:rhodanese-like domain-containing protein [Cyclobacteriaceae bacterium]
MFNLFSFGSKAYEGLQAETFKQKLKETKGILVDVRTAAEFKSGSITGARNIDVMSPSFLTQFAGLDKAKTYFIYCRSGARSAQACTMLSKQGFKVYNLKGGIMAWPY